MAGHAATIVVLGDIGHSPRMCNHAYSFASHGVKVTIVGYLNSKPHQKIINHENIRVFPIVSPPCFLSPHNPVLRIALLPIKFIWMFIVLTISLLKTCEYPSRNDSANILILQNPPGIPTIFVSYLITRIKRATFLIDWHNYTYSMFPQNIFSRLIAIIEGRCGRLSDINLCVSKTMQNDLLQRWGIHSKVLYDRPLRLLFRNIEADEKCNFLVRFIETHCPEFNESFFCSPDEGLFLREHRRPIILVSSTSWTPDEDFSILLDALRNYDAHISRVENEGDISKRDKLKILVIITGKGPQKEMYLKQINSFEWQNVLILTPWLEAEDYPKLLSCADIGVCLHTSTTGFDLPMKVVDMFGSSLPVLAKRFVAISELVEDGVNGMLFDTKEDLERLIMKYSVPNSQELKKLRDNVSKNFSSWEENWDDIVWSSLSM